MRVIFLMRDLLLRDWELTDCNHVAWGVIANYTPMPHFLKSKRIANVDATEIAIDDLSNIGSKSLH